MVSVVVLTDCLLEKVTVIHKIYIFKFNFIISVLRPVLEDLVHHKSTLVMSSLGYTSLLETKFSPDFLYNADY